MPAVSIILVSHNKPAFVREAIQSVLSQTFTNWECFLVDSGILFRQNFFQDVTDSRVKVSISGETPELARHTNMASWCFNRLLNSGSLQGDLIMYLCDDDLLYPEAFTTFWEFYKNRQGQPHAMYASQDIGLVEADGRTRIIGRRRALKPAGRHCKGVRLDSRVDYLQFCHSAAILQKYSQVYSTTQFHSEDKRDAAHADGIFMERIGAITAVYPIDKVLSMNRRTVQSVNLEHSSSAFGRLLITLKQKFKGGLDRVRHGRRW